MIFNRGFMCGKCGPIQTAKKRSIQKVQRDCCPDCGGIVTKWERPLNERAGRCGNCTGATFTMSMENRQLMRTCKECGEKVNTDRGCEVVTKGKRAKKYVQKV